MIKYFKYANKCFRKDERGLHHLPELTMLEWYSANETYVDLMNQCESLIQFIALRMDIGRSLPYQKNTINLSSPWQRLTIKSAFEQYCDIPVDLAIEKNKFDELVSHNIEHKLGHVSPVFLIDYPSSYASLAKLLPDDPGYAQRFELYISGIELANGFTELTDTDEQKKRFETENRIRMAHGKSTIPLPEKFLADLKKLPDSVAGIAMGIDRLVMLFSDVSRIDDVVTFTPEDM